jgi:hypothetical protein
MGLLLHPPSGGLKLPCLHYLQTHLP